MFQRALQSLRRATVRTMVGGTIVIGTLEVTTHLPTQGRSSEFYHDLADNIVTPFLRRFLTPEQAHDLVIYVAKEYPTLMPTHRPSALEQRIDVAQTLFGGDSRDGHGHGHGAKSSSSSSAITFPNAIGLAAGFDKDGVAMESFLQLGFGFCEIGSVTLQPQPGNPSPRMFRLLQDDAIINRYGFNSVGANEVEENLKAFRRGRSQKQEQEQKYGHADGHEPEPKYGLVGVNLGKNKTSTATPVADYQALIRRLGPHADYLVVNVSSPNTPGLRDLQARSSLEELLTACLQTRNELEEQEQENEDEQVARKRKRKRRLPPLLVKLSPDLSDEELQEIAALLLQLQIDGIILTNTTTERPDSLMSRKNKNETGGLSGRPLKQRSTECIRNMYKWTKGSIPIIGVGGVFDAHDVYEKLKAGASLVQVYSGMVYQGPGLISKIRHDLAVLLLQNGHRHIQDVVGLDHDELYWQKRQEQIIAKQQQQQTETMIVAVDGEMELTKTIIFPEENEEEDMGDTTTTDNWEEPLANDDNTSVVDE